MNLKKLSPNPRSIPAISPFLYFSWSQSPFKCVPIFCLHFLYPPRTGILPYCLLESLLSRQLYIPWHQVTFPSPFCFLRSTWHSISLPHWALSFLCLWNTTLSWFSFYFISCSFSVFLPGIFCSQDSQLDLLFPQPHSFSYTVQCISGMLRDIFLTLHCTLQYLEV